MDKLRNVLQLLDMRSTARGMGAGRLCACFYKAGARGCRIMWSSLCYIGCVGLSRYCLALVRIREDYYLDNDSTKMG